MTGEPVGLDGGDEPIAATGALAETGGQPGGPVGQSAGIQPERHSGNAIMVAFWILGFQSSGPEQLPDAVVIVYGNVQVDARHGEVRVTGGDADLGQCSAKRPLRYRAVLPQEKRLESRSQRYWN